MIESFKKIKCDLCGTSLEYKERKQYNNEFKWYDRETDKEIPVWKRPKLSVVFLTEQNEGTPTKPYFDIETLDLCPECYEKLITEYPIIARGAQGYNTYTWREK